MLNSISLKAYAKINLALDVLGRRENGYHDVKMIMQNLDIYDELDFELIGPGDEIIIEANREDIPTDGRNLIAKAIRLMYEEYKVSSSIKVKLVKNIPVEAGMAGGSTDCAAALKAVNELFSLGADTNKLMELGVKLGADVPYCVLSQAALSEGIGEILTPIKGLKNCFVLVAKPPVGVSTAMVYKNLKLDESLKHPDVDGMVEALKNEDLNGVAERLGNVLESVTTVLYPEIDKLKDTMKEHGALNAIMSGSGPTVFGLYEDEETAKTAAEFIKQSEMANQIFVTVPNN